MSYFRHLFLNKTLLLMYFHVQWHVM